MVPAVPLSGLWPGLGGSTPVDQQHSAVAAAV